MPLEMFIYGVPALMLLFLSGFVYNVIKTVVRGLTAKPIARQAVQAFVFLALAVGLSQWFQSRVHFTYLRPDADGNYPKTTLQKKQKAEQKEQEASQLEQNR